MDPIAKGREVLRLTDEVNRMIARRNLIEQQLISMDMDIAFLRREIERIVNGNPTPKYITTFIQNRIQNQKSI